MGSDRCSRNEAEQSAGASETQCDASLGEHHAGRLLPVHEVVGADAFVAHAHLPSPDEPELDPDVAGTRPTPDASREWWLHEAQRIAGLGHYVFDIERDHWEGSPALYDLLGMDTTYERDIAAWLAITHPDDRSRLARYLSEDVLDEHRPFDFEYRIVRPQDGSERWVRGRGDMHFAADGAPLAMIGIVQDITERKRYEESLGIYAELLLQSNARLERMVYSVAEAMGRVVEARDPYTQGHQQRTAKLARLIAIEMGLSEYDAEGVQMAAVVHDIGKLSVPQSILNKPGPLTEAEFCLIRPHTTTGFEILKDIDFPWPVAQAVLQHHERLDGSGYPDGLKDDEICTAAKILAVADVIDAMASHRPYRPALGVDSGVAEIAAHPELYDPEVISACVRLHECEHIA